MWAPARRPAAPEAAPVSCHRPAEAPRDLALEIVGDAAAIAVDEARDLRLGAQPLHGHERRQDAARIGLDGDAPRRDCRAGLQPSRRSNELQTPLGDLLEL